jgi:hypothetical protein
MLVFPPTGGKETRKQNQKMNVFIKPQVREGEEKGEMVRRGLRVTRGTGCHLQLTGRLLEPTPTTCLLANTLISWKGFEHSGELNPAKGKTESNEVRMMQGAVSESVVETDSRA